jgi:hypothetical protein
VYFLCNSRESEALLKESPIHWHKDYPKLKDCEWKLRTGDEKSWQNWNPLEQGNPVFTSAFDVERK